MSKVGERGGRSKQKCEAAPRFPAAARHRGQPQSPPRTRHSPRAATRARCAAPPATRAPAPAAAAHASAPARGRPARDRARRARPEPPQPPPTHALPGPQTPRWRSWRSMELNNSRPASNLRVRWRFTRTWISQSSQAAARLVLTNFVSVFSISCHSAFRLVSFAALHGGLPRRDRPLLGLGWRRPLVSLLSASSQKLLVPESPRSVCAARGGRHCVSLL